MVQAPCGRIVPCSGALSALVQEALAYKVLVYQYYNTSTTTKQFKDLKYNIQKQIRNAYWLYIESVIFTGDSQPCSNKKFYSFVKHNKTEQCGVAPLKHQVLTYSDPVDKANFHIDNLNWCSLSKPQPLSLKQLAKQATASIYTPKMQIIDISIEGVDKLQGLSPNKASGPDELSPKMLKELHLEIAPILTFIFNVSLETGVVPLDWRTADVVPVYKKGSKSKASNYRSISFTCIASKLLEHILVSNIMSHFYDNNLLASTSIERNTVVNLNLSVLRKRSMTTLKMAIKQISL